MDFTSLQKLPKTPYIPKADITLDPAKVIAVNMHQAAVTNPFSHQTILGAYSVTSCLALAVHNHNTGATGLAHLARGDDPKEFSRSSFIGLMKMMDTVSDGVKAPLEVRMIGMYTSANRDANRDLLQGIISTLKSYDPYCEILSADVHDKSGPSDFAVDSLRWNEGLIRGALEGYLFLDPSEKASKEIKRQKLELVDLDFLPHSPAVHRIKGAFEDCRGYQQMPQNLPDFDC